jgi:aspartyl-tRNA(Asn)/glutamyl-tRNA(Gln) amidotransferase subunit C
VASADIDVAYVAKLARIALSPGEIERFGVELRALLEHVATLEKLPVANVPATAQVVPSTNVLRDDIARPSLARAVVLAGAPASQGAYFRVPRIIAEES